MSTIQDLFNREILKHPADSSQKVARFFKTSPGEYAEHDRFLGIPVPTLRRMVRQCALPTLSDIEAFLLSPFNEARMLGLLCLIRFYDEKDISQREEAFAFYQTHLDAVNNWNLVDLSAPLIMGRHLLFIPHLLPLLDTLATSHILWHRRIAIVATWYFIRHGQLDKTFQLAATLRDDREDLMHKAVGWMLREAGKKDEAALETFLKKHASFMPRTMLRYAIERFEPLKRKAYLSISNKKV